MVPLCIGQTLSAIALPLYREFEAVVWWATPVEIASVFARLMRMKQISSRDWVAARQIAEELAEEWSTIQPSEAVRTEATGLLNRYPLRTADALQLAAALAWCNHSPQGSVFLTADDRLREAAVLSGFDTGSL